MIVSLLSCFEVYAHHLQGYNLKNNSLFSLEMVPIPKASETMLQR